MNEARRIAIIADDLTGACDTGVQFASPGSPTTVYVADTRLVPVGKHAGEERLEAKRLDDELDAVNEAQDPVIVDTESRHLTAEEAYDRVRAVANYLGESSVDLVYKKIDSTLRGNVLSELVAMQDAFPDRITVFAPAYPAAGRTVVDGRCLVDGRPVDATEFGRDRRSPVTSAKLADYVRSVARVVQTRTDSLAAVLGKASAGDVLIVDASTDGELDAVAALIAADPRRYIPVGSAGLAGAIHRTRATVDAGAGTRAAGSPSETPLPVLGIVGSVSERSRLQAARLIESRTVVSVVLDPASISAQVDRVAEALSSGQKVLLITPMPERRGKPSPENEATTLARSLGDIAREVVDRVPRIGLFMTGGDTALSVMHALGARTLLVYRELAAGIPVVAVEYRCGDSKTRIPAITKAGGFGSDTIHDRGIRLPRRRNMLAVTMGDANGVGPEILIRAFVAGLVPRDAVVYGDLSALRYAARRMEIPESIVDEMSVVDLGTLTESDITPGRVSSKVGAASVAYVERATKDAIAGKVDAIVTPAH